MNDSHITSIAQLAEILASEHAPSFVFETHGDAYAWVASVLDRFKYLKRKHLKKKEKMFVRRYIARYTAYSKSQITRLIKEKKKNGALRYGKGKKRHQFARIYQKSDVELLAEADNIYKRMSGDAMRGVFKDEYELYGKTAYERLARISHSHLYRLRGTPRYKEQALTIGRTIAVSSSIGIRKKPDTQGKPGYIRADTVHQGDFEGVKGVYHINLVDEVTQWEWVGCVDSITEASMAFVLREALASFPFVILGFHSDNGGENINGSVADLLQRQLIEQTKSRSGRCNDNALIEGKNGSVVRKHFGHWHIPKYEARKIHAFNREWFNEFLNFHRMCQYPTVVVFPNGKKKKNYDETCTPVQKLLSLKGVESYLKDGITIASLKKTMLRMSHLEFTKQMDAAKQKLFTAIKKC